MEKDVRTETLYQEIIKVFLDKGTIEAVAASLDVSEVKVRKVLITEGLWSSPTSVRVTHYFEMGMTTGKIAELLHTTVKAVQQYIPYTKGFYQGDHPSENARYSAEYRERIRIAKENVLKKNREIYIQEGWEIMSQEKETKSESQERIPQLDNESKHFQDHYPGQVCLRSLPEGMVDWEKARCTGIDIVRLHLELRRDSFHLMDVGDDGHQKENLKESYYDEEETRVLKTYGHVQFGETISRDILIPSDMPLYALHYAIQRLFGWQNSHLHRYEIPPKKFVSLTGNRGENWLKLIGILFQSPLMREEDHFWADDYEYGSFKTWLRRKYTGPYTSLCHGEGLIQCTRDIKRIKKEYPFFDVSYVDDGGELSVSDVRWAPEGCSPGEIPVTETDRKDLWGREIIRREIVRLEDCDAMGLVRFFAESGANNLLERLTIDDVLALHAKHPEDAIAEGEEIFDTFERFMDEDIKEDVKEILRAKIDRPSYQPMTNTPTDVLYYYYDYGDDWRIRITGSYDACDLIEQGRVSQEQLDEAIAKVHMTYRPVCIAADGLSLVDDAGGVWGYVQFLRSQHPREEAVFWGKDHVPDNGPYDEKQESLTWAKGLGWTDHLNIKRML